MVVEQFTYKERIPPHRHSLIPSDQVIGSNNAPFELVITRLLLGTLEVQDNISNKIIKPLYDFSQIDYTTHSVVSEKQLKNFLHAENHTFSDFSSYLGNTHKYGNNMLFKNFLLELTHFFFNHKSKNDTLAFLHLYRALELISYTFPLYYASKSTSYHGSFLKLKDFFKSATAEGEKSFLKNFVTESLFKGDPILDVNLSIFFNSGNALLKKQHFELTTRLSDSKWIKTNTPNDEIVTSRRYLISLMITLRNRHFHLSEGDYNDNVKMVENYSFDEYFGSFNLIFCNWIAQIYFKILSAAIEHDK